MVEVRKGLPRKKIAGSNNGEQPRDTYHFKVK